MPRTPYLEFSAPGRSARGFACYATLGSEPLALIDSNLITTIDPKTALNYAQQNTHQHFEILPNCLWTKNVARNCLHSSQETFREVYQLKDFQRHSQSVDHHRPRADRASSGELFVHFHYLFVFFLLTASAFRCQGGIRLEPALEVLVRPCYCSTTLPLDFTTVSFAELQNEIRHEVELHSSNSLWTPLKDIFPLEDGQELVHLSWIADENRDVASSAGEWKGYVFYFGWDCSRDFFRTVITNLFFPIQYDVFSIDTLKSWEVDGINVFRAMCKDTSFRNALCPYLILRISLEDAQILRINS